MLLCFFFFKQKTAYEIGLGIPAEPLFRSRAHPPREPGHGRRRGDGRALRRCPSHRLTSPLAPCFIEPVCRTTEAMQPFRLHKGLVAPIDRENVDTDAIIPKQFLKSIKRTGFGVNLFDEWRYLDHGEPGQDPTSRRSNPDFVLNQPRYRDRKSGSAGMPRPISYAVFCLKKKKQSSMKA
eukprot:TRINITY_DN6302_c0_g1_i5.p1 TRINITY_DN6302_c0_g1~~TRINITY_DN6302_c0_g1_i5.p1  ORF type:complete len:180 (+),score=53.71 TRINITY_DN6302_c0_g1_i5:18-557(+)